MEARHTYNWTSQLSTGSVVCVCPYLPSPGIQHTRSGNTEQPHLEPALSGSSELLCQHPVPTRALSKFPGAPRLQRSVRVYNLTDSMKTLVRPNGLHSSRFVIVIIALSGYGLPPCYVPRTVIFIILIWWLHPMREIQLLTPFCRWREIQNDEVTCPQVPQQIVKSEFLTTMLYRISMCIHTHTFLSMCVYIIYAKYKAGTFYLSTFR